MTERHKQKRDELLDLYDLRDEVVIKAWEEYNLHWKGKPRQQGEASDVELSEEPGEE